MLSMSTLTNWFHTARFFFPDSIDKFFARKMESLKVPAKSFKIPLLVTGMVINLKASFRSHVSTQLNLGSENKEPKMLS